MKLFLPLYLKMTRNKFTRAFKPIGVKRKSAFFVSAPLILKDLIRTLPFLENLRGLGPVALFLPRSCEPFTRYFRPGLFDFVFYDKLPVLLTREFKILQEQFQERSFESLIEINEPANLHLPYLIRTEKRIAFYNPKNYPYYNILLKGGIKALSDFYRFETTNPKKIFHITEAESHKLDRRLGKKHPLLFVNGPDERAWDGDKFVLGRDYLAEAEIPKIIYLCDAYYGLDDEWREIAKLFGKTILV
jgi:hypothetical protein